MRSRQLTALGDRHPVLVYTLLRMVVFLACAGALTLVGARGVVLLVLAVLLSGVLSLRLLSRQRDAVSAALVAQKRRVDESAAGEDEPTAR